MLQKVTDETRRIYLQIVERKQESGTIIIFYLMRTCLCSYRKIEKNYPKNRKLVLCIVLSLICP